MKKEFEHSIGIPVPMGTPVYRAITVCGDFCLFQKDRFSELKEKGEEGFCNHCSDANPCHTRFFTVKKMSLDFSNLDIVLKEWGTRIFETEKEAEEAGNAIAEKNRKTMQDLGFKLDDTGYSIIKKRGEVSGKGL